MNNITDINIKLHRLSSKLWINKNYNYYNKVNNLRSKVKSRKNAIPRLEAKIIQYVKDLESYMIELKNIERSKLKDNKKIEENKK